MFMTIIEKLGLTKEMLKTENYQITFIQETENVLIAIVESKKFTPLLIELLNEKLHINKKEKSLQWFKDFIEIQKLSDEERVDFAKNGKYLDILINARNSNVRGVIAQQGYGLNKLVYDGCWLVRGHVANQSYGLDILVNDEHWAVREAVAEQRYGLDKLIHDVDWRVRKAVAKQGYGLNLLVNDSHEYVRVTIALQGYGLDKLLNDKTDWVVDNARTWLEDNNLTLEQWKGKYPERCVLNK